MTLGGYWTPSSKVEIANLDKAANDLWAVKGAALVVSGSNDPNVQIVVHAINELLGSNGTTVDFTAPVYFRIGNDARMNQFVTELKAGQVGGVIFYNCNPVYDHARGAEIAEGIAKAKVSISTNGTLDETSSLVQIVAPSMILLFDSLNIVLHFQGFHCQNKY